MLTRVFLKEKFFATNMPSLHCRCTDKKESTHHGGVCVAPRAPSGRGGVAQRHVGVGRQQHVGEHGVIGGTQALARARSVPREPVFVVIIVVPQFNHILLLYFLMEKSE